MKITAKYIFITKCILWIISIIIIPAFLWYGPSHTYKVDKSTIKVINTENGEEVQILTMKNSFGHNIHVTCVPQMDSQYTYYDLYINGKKYCRLREFVLKDTYAYIGISLQITIITLVILFIQIISIVTILHFLSYRKTIKLKAKEKPCETSTGYIVYEPYIYYGSDIKSDDLWFSKIFGLHTTWKQLVSINKFFGYDVREELQYPTYETMLNNNYFHKIF